MKSKSCHSTLKDNIEFSIKSFHLIKGAETHKIRIISLSRCTSLPSGHLFIFFPLQLLEWAEMDFDRWFDYKMNRRAGINVVRLLREPTCEMLTALISPWTGQAWSARPRCASMPDCLDARCTAISAAAPTEPAYK